MNSNYVMYLRSEKKSERTIELYVRIISEMLDCVKKEEKNITEADMLNWRNTMSKLSAASICQKLSAVNNYFNFLQMAGAVNSNPVIAMSRPSIKHKEKKFVEGYMVRDMINAATNIRDKAMVMLLSSTGLRVSEFIGLTVDGFNKAKADPEHALIICGKGSKERTVFLNDEVVGLIDSYLPVRNSKDKGFDNLFLSNQGRPMEEERISKTLKVIARKANLPYAEQISPHWLRAACASINLENGAPITAVRDLLGHSSIAVTNVYAKSSRNTVKNICMNCAF